MIDRAARLPGIRFDIRMREYRVRSRIPSKDPHYEESIMCSCQENNSGEHVPNFAATGFDGGVSVQGGSVQLEGVEALKLSVCVSASYNPANRQLCFTIPIYGNYCITLPVPIPVGGQIKVCAQTCGSLIPTGLKATVYANNTPIYSITLWGKC